MGFNPDRLAKVVSSASGDRPALPLKWMFAVLGVVFAAAAIVTWRALPSNGATKQAPSS